MRLSDLKIGQTAQVDGLHLQAMAARRFEMLGLTPGAKVQVLQKKRNGTMVLRFRGARYAVGHAFTHKIEMKPERKREET